MPLLSIEDQKAALDASGWTCTHVDTCLPCYLLDHMNGDNEMLLGVPVDGDSTFEMVRADLQAELGYSTIDKPGFDFYLAQIAIDSAFLEHAGDDPFDPSLDVMSEADVEADVEAPQAWFRIAWEVIA